MTELARIDTTTGEVATVRPSIVGGFAADLADAYTIAKALCGTAFVPKDFRGKPEETAAAILTGSELGLSPMASLRAIHVIQGRPTLSAAVMRAVCQAAGHSLTVVEATASRVVVEGSRRGSQHVQRSAWSMDRAKNAGLTGKDNWKNFPQEMLTARATAEVARLIAADLLHGLYTEDEVDEPAPLRREPVRRKPKEVAAVPEPDLEPEPASAEPEPEPAVVEGITAAQLRKMGALMRDLGLTDREQAIAWVRETVGREGITSRNDLTKDEATRLIDVGERFLEPEPEPELDGAL